MVVLGYQGRAFHLRHGWSEIIRNQCLGAALQSLERHREYRGRNLGAQGTEGVEESGVCILNIRLPWKHNWEGDRAHDLKLEVSQDTQERLGTENKFYPCITQSGVTDYFTPEILSAKASENKYYQHCCRLTKYFEFLNKIIFICWHSQLTFTAISCHIGELCHFDENPCMNQPASCTSAQDQDILPSF